MQGVGRNKIGYSVKLREIQIGYSVRVREIRKLQIKQDKVIRT